MKATHEHGYYLDRGDKGGHKFDQQLCDALGLFFHGQSVLDIGCGHGLYVREFLRCGVHANGIDGNPRTAELSEGTCSVSDIATFPMEVPAPGVHDWVLCLEVGEHVPKRYQQAVFANIVTNARAGVILSWAVPGQPGRCHVNCKKNADVITTMTARGLHHAPELEANLRRLSTMEYFKNTVMAFVT